MADASTLQRTLDDLVQRIVRPAHPRRIILFGSAAKGHIGPNSDLDVLVVMQDGTHRRQTAQIIYRSLMELGTAKGSQIGLFALRMGLPLQASRTLTNWYGTSARGNAKE